MPVDVRILIQVDRPPTEIELGEWNRQLLDLFDNEDFRFGVPLSVTEGWEFDIIEKYPQHTWLQSHWAHNYYGEGYERGNFPSIVDYIDTLQKLIPKGVIYYGRDCTDDVELFSDQRQRLSDHWNRVGNEPYDSRMIAFRKISFLPTLPAEYSNYLKVLSSEASKIETNSSIAPDGSIQTDLFSGSHPTDEAGSSQEAGLSEIDPSTYIRCETNFEAMDENISE